MEIKWLGHSCFVLTDGNGVSIMTDPPAPDVGYKIPPQRVDAVTVSHSHHDHNYLALAEGNPKVISTAGEHEVRSVRVTGVHTWHDDAHGEKRGDNIMFIFDMDGMRVLHAGDLGHELDEDCLNAVGNIDVLLIPIGGVYTVDYHQALDVANQLKPSVLIPMHYQTAALTTKLGELNQFLNTAQNCSLHRLRQNTAVLSADSLGSDRIITLDYSVEA